jgi:Zn-dependent protease with chaperone function
MIYSTVLRLLLFVDNVFRCLREPLKKIHEENASNLLLDPLYAAYHHSHPSLVERTRAITLLLNKQQ